MTNIFENPPWTKPAEEALRSYGLPGDRLLVDVKKTTGLAKVCLIAPGGQGQEGDLVAWVIVHVSGEVLASSITEGGEY